jgi:hypothetical protein
MLDADALQQVLRRPACGARRRQWTVCWSSSRSRDGERSRHPLIVA